MQNRELDTIGETKTSLSEKVVKRQTGELKAQSPLVSRHDPPAQVACRLGDASSASAHDSMLNRVTTPRPPAAEHSILQLQQQYGNRYVQRVLALARKGQGEGEAAQDVEQAIQRARGGGQALDGGVRAQMEPAFGSDFSGVRVHANAEADTLNHSLSARAFTTGQDIFFRQGAYNPGSSSGRELLAHELTHVVQQNGDQVQRKLTVGQPGDRYEQEADQTAQAIMQQEQQPVQRESEEVLVHRQEEEEEEKQIQSKALSEQITSSLQRQEEEKEE